MHDRWAEGPKGAPHRSDTRYCSRRLVEFPDFIRYERGAGAA